MWHFAGSERQKHHEIVGFFHTPAASRGHTAIVVIETARLSATGDEIQLSRNKVGGSCLFQLPHVTGRLWAGLWGRQGSGHGRRGNQYFQAAFAEAVNFG